MIEDDNDISIRIHEELGRFESLCGREYTHTRINDVSLLERVGMHIELPTVLCAIRWEKLYEVPRSATNIAACTDGRHVPQLLRPTSHSRACSHGGSTVGCRRTIGSPSVALVGH
jgi:hypothetical protein